MWRRCSGWLPFVILLISEEVRRISISFRSRLRSGSPPCRAGCARLPPSGNRALCDSCCCLMFVPCHQLTPSNPDMNILPCRGWQWWAVPPLPHFKHCWFLAASLQPGSQGDFWISPAQRVSWSGELGRVNCQALGRSLQRSLSAAVDTLRPDGISPPGLWYHQLFHTFQVFGGTQSSQLRVWESLCLSVRQSVQDALEMPLPTLTTLRFSVPAPFPTVTWCYSLDPSTCQSILLLFLSFLLLFTTYSFYPTFLFHSIP